MVPRAERRAAPAARGLGPYKLHQPRIAAAHVILKGLLEAHPRLVRIRSVLLEEPA